MGLNFRRSEVSGDYISRLKIRENMIRLRNNGIMNFLKILLFLEHPRRGENINLTVYPRSNSPNLPKQIELARNTSDVIQRKGRNRMEKGKKEK